MYRPLFARGGCFAARPLARPQYFLTANGFRPRHDRQQRGIKTALGDEKTGHIKAGPNEAILYFDQVFPLRLQFLFRGSNPHKDLVKLMQRFNSPSIAAADPIRIIKRAIPADAPLKITEIIPRLNDGGAFVKFSHDAHITAKEIEGLLKAYLKDSPIQPWFNPWAKLRTFLVKGQPWVEDLKRIPSTILRVEFVPVTPGAGEPVALSQEDLYSLFRKYGKLGDIETQPSDSKILPKYAYVKFSRVRKAIMAKSCMHGFQLLEEAGGGKAGTELRISYEAKAKPHWIRDWLFSHPRIVVPLVAALLATLTVAIFDPIRTFFVKAHVTRNFHISDNIVFKWLVKQADTVRGTFGKYRPDQYAGLTALWEDRKQDIEQVQTWLLDSADTFIVIQGPRGAGKKELVMQQALKDRKNTLLIDLKPVQEARGDTATIAKAALEVGYRPVFPWMNSVSSLIDLAAQGAIGAKTGFSETLDSQLTKICSTTSGALRQVALQSRKSDDKDSQLSDDEYLDAHPERRPVVVIDNFLHKSQESSIVYDKIAEWCASLTTQNIAHVIFLTHDVSFSKSLSKALPDRVFRQISLGDCQPETAKRFVLGHLDADPDDAIMVEGKKVLPSQRREDLKELDGSIEQLGGRLTDLEFLARRMKSGETPMKAVRQIIEQSASEILKMYLLDIDTSSRVWTPDQAWLLVSQLADNESLRYNEVLLSDTFKSGSMSAEKTLASLESAELISITSYNGRPSSIRPGKPVYTAAFKLLMADHGLKSRLDLSTLTNLTKIETASIEKTETELGLLSTLGARGSPGVYSRVEFLLDKLNKSQQKVESYEAQSAKLKKILQAEF
ncbi:MAG: mitochondrial escape protein 2 [Vezdaea aestivalis]|nr:MAG: mitochondrial escape protein 2 [Vezdaea aestivalis]